MRLVLVAGIFPPDIGGPATHLSDLREELTGRGHRVTVLTLTDRARSIHRPGLVAFPRRWPWPARMAAVSAWLIRHRSRFDAVYASGLHPAAVAGAKTGGRPVAVKAAADPAWERSVRLGLTIEGFETFQRSSQGSLRLRAMRALRDWSMRHADMVIVPSEHLAPHARVWTRGRTRVEVVPNGVRLPDPRPLVSRRDGDLLRGIFVGRLAPVKRVDVLIEALARVDGARLDVVGDGPSRGDLEALAQRLAVSDRVRFTGILGHDAVMRRLAAADVLLLASEHEGLPHVVLEAMACGTPVAAPRVGGVPEVVVDGDNGLLLPVASAETVAEALARLGRDPELRARLARRASSDAQKWRLEGTVLRVEQLLRSCVPKPRAVLVGKTRLARPLGSVHRGRLEVLAAHLRPVVVGTGPPRIERLEGGALVVAFPTFRPRVLEDGLFYAGGPALAVALTAGGRGAVVCQSAFEGLGTILLASALPRSLRPAVLIEAHGDWRASSRLYGSPMRPLLAPAADRAAAWAIRRADGIRVVSPWLIEQVRRAGYTKDIEVFPAFVDVSAFMEGPPAAPPETPVAAFVGVLQDYKGVDVLLEAWRSVVDAVPAARLVLAGEGPRLDDERRRAGALGIDGTVSFLGAILPGEVVELMDRSTCLVLPSRSEGLPRVVMEALARGRPVVATRVGGTPELVEDGRNGFVVDPEDPSGLAAALVKVLGDLPYAARLGEEARRGALAYRPLDRFEEGVRRLADWIASR